MCIFGGPSIPSPPPLPPPPPPPPKPLDPAITRARTRDRQQATLAGGRDKTILTSGLGLTDKAVSANKSLLGS